MKAQSDIRFPQVYQYPSLKIRVKSLALSWKLPAQKLFVKSKKAIIRLVTQYESQIADVSATAFTGTVFLLVFYLFLIQLAEHGW